MGFSEDAMSKEMINRPSKGDRAAAAKAAVLKARNDHMTAREKVTNSLREAAEANDAFNRALDHLASLAGEE